MLNSVVFRHTFFDFGSCDERKGYRTALIIQNDLLFKAIQSTTVMLPISNPKTSMPFEVELPKTLKTTGKVSYRQIRALYLSTIVCKYVESVPEKILNDCLDIVTKIISK